MSARFILWLLKSQKLFQAEKYRRKTAEKENKNVYIAFNINMVELKPHMQ